MPIKGHALATIILVQAPVENVADGLRALSSGTSMQEQVMMSSDGFAENSSPKSLGLQIAVEKIRVRHARMNPKVGESAADIVRQGREGKLYG